MIGIQHFHKKYPDYRIRKMIIGTCALAALARVKFTLSKESVNNWPNPVTKPLE